MLPSKDARDILPVDNRLLVATYFGMGVLRGAACRPWSCMASMVSRYGRVHGSGQPGFAGDYWPFATPFGAVACAGG